MKAYAPFIFLVAALLCLANYSVYVHDKATRLDACVNEYQPSEGMTPEVVNYCEEKINGQIKR